MDLVILSVGEAAARDRTTAESVDGVEGNWCSTLRALTIAMHEFVKCSPQL
jgi:hypothetical protein